MATEPLANSAFHEGSHDGRSNAPACRDTESSRAWIGVTPRRNDQNEGLRVQANAIPRHPLIVASLAEAVAAPEALAAAIDHLLPVETESCLRPFARRRFNTARPACVRMRIRNPCVRRLLIRLG